MKFLLVQVTEYPLHDTLEVTGCYIYQDVQSNYSCHVHNVVRSLQTCSIIVYSKLHLYEMELFSYLLADSP